jgi:hypothetical protein
MSRRRPAVHPVPKQMSSDEIDSEMESYHVDELTGQYRFNKVNKVKKPPGPGTYSVRKEYTAYQAPRATIGKEERFSSTFAGMFVRAECASELQCRDSPGPVYSPGFSNMPRAQTVSWGSKRSQENVVRFQNNLNTGGRDSNGPAAYHPQHNKILPQATVVNFGRSHRFDSFGGHAYAIHNSPYTGTTEPTPKLDYVRPTTASFSFGGGRVRPPRGDDPDARSRPRTAFITHTIRGGLARPATMECGVGPADYNTNQTAIDQNLSKESKYHFGTAPRFTRPGLVFVSSEHAKADGNVFSPGPKYSTEIGSIRFKQRQPLASLHWCP